MKILHKEISKCGDCPYCHWVYRDGECKGCVCRNMPRYSSMLDLWSAEKPPETIPSFCPLPDKEDKDADKG